MDGYCKLNPHFLLNLFKLNLIQSHRRYYVGNSPPLSAVATQEDMTVDLFPPTPSHKVRVCSEAPHLNATSLLSTVLLLTIFLLRGNVTSLCHFTRGVPSTHSRGRAPSLAPDDGQLQALGLLFPSRRQARQREGEAPGEAARAGPRERKGSQPHWCWLQQVRNWNTRRPPGSKMVALSFQLSSSPGPQPKVPGFPIGKNVFRPH